MKDYSKSKFFFTIKNVKPFIGAKFYFDNIKNVFDVEYSKESGQLQSNISGRITVPEGFPKEKAVEAMIEMVEKTWKRKKITFSAFIKDKDSFLSDGKGGYLDVNRKFDNKISFLDIANFFGKDNVTLHSNYFPKTYSLISDTVVEELSEKYRKRYKDSLENSSELAVSRKKQKKIGKLEARKSELSSSYIYMKYFEYIRTHFSYNGKPFLAQMPTLDKLRLNFFENERKEGQENEDSSASFVEAAKRARLIYEPQTSSILVPIGRKIGSAEKVEPFFPEEDKAPWWEKAEWLAPNETYINLFMKYIFSYIKRIYSDKDQGRSEKNKKWNRYETYKIKKVFTENLSEENSLRLEMTKIKQVLLNPIFSQLLQFPYKEGRAYLRQYFEYLSYLIGRICYRTSIIKMEFVEEDKNFIKRYFQSAYWRNRHKFDKIFERNFKYDFGDTEFEDINRKLKNRGFEVEDYEILRHLANEEYQHVEDQLFQKEKKEFTSESGGGTSIMRNDIIFKGKIDENNLSLLFRNASEPAPYKIDIDKIATLDFRNKKTLISVLFKENIGIYSRKIDPRICEGEPEPKDCFGLKKMELEEILERTGTAIALSPLRSARLENEKRFYHFIKKHNSILQGKEVEVNIKEVLLPEEITEMQKEVFGGMKRDALERIEELIRKETSKQPSEENEENEKAKDNSESVPQEMFEDILYDAFHHVMEKKKVTRMVEDRNGGKEACDFYAVNIYDYNIDMFKPKVLSIIKSVLFKPLIDELRPFVIGQRNKEGKTVKKSIKLNDWETIEKIIAFKHEQLLLLIEAKKKTYEKELESFNKGFYEKVLSEYTVKVESAEASEEVKQLMRERVKVSLQENYAAFIKKKKEEFEWQIKNAQENLLPNTIEENRRLAKEYSINFIVKNINAKEKDTSYRSEGAAIFLEDIHNEVKKYKGFNCRKDTDGEMIYEKISSENALIKSQTETIEKHNSELVEIDIEFILADAILKLSRVFTFAVPFIREYSEKVTDQFITLAFFDNIDNVEKFVNGAVFNASNLNILKSKYKLFRNHPEVEKEVSYKKEQKIEKKMMNYNDYLKLKYKEGAMLKKQNPFEITPENVPLYEGLSNCWKYHRILDENVKYLYTNIDSTGEIIIYSKLFSHYEEFAIQMLTLDRGLRYAWRKRGKPDVEFRNYRVRKRIFDVYVAGEFYGTVKLDIESGDSSYTVENIYEKIKKILRKERN